MSRAPGYVAETYVGARDGFWFGQLLRRFFPISHRPLVGVETVVAGDLRSRHKGQYNDHADNQQAQSRKKPE